jgi:hypothetical protein
VGKGIGNGGLILAGRVIRRTKRQLDSGDVRVRVTVLAGGNTEALELFNVPDDDVPAIGADISMPVYIRVYVDRGGTARYSLQPVSDENDF